MWTIETNQINENSFHSIIFENEKQISFRRWTELILDSAEFIEFFNSNLTAVNFDGYFWEVKPVNKDSFDQGFEYVIIKSNILAKIQGSKNAFQEHFTIGEQVVSFPNLGGDAQLVVPADLGDHLIYGHLAEFLDSAPKQQIIAFWQRVALEYKSKIGPEWKWLSTAGLGVPWLHVRIDSTPKYYRYNPYRNV